MDIESQSTEDNDQDIPALLSPDCLPELDSTTTHLPECLADDPLRQISHLVTLLQRRDHLNLIEILPPITEAYISSLEHAGRDTLCAICCADLLDTAESSSSEVLQLPCAHLFHGACLASWFDYQITCPMCRFDPDFHVIVENLFAGFEPHLYEWLKTDTEAIRGPRNPEVELTVYRDSARMRSDIRDGNLGITASGDPEQEVD
ncbi:hypothetical protein B0H13DRAFT_2039287 [Mycena leptocephala]|nr:hypothetical protein B0H13DRAFT_2039287 [Mycena leptocephala]